MSSVDLAAAAESLHRARVLLRLAGPLVEPGRKETSPPWMAWLGGEEAGKEARRVATVHRLAARGHFREITAMEAGAMMAPPVDPRALLHWLASARHPRPLLRWCAQTLDDESGAVSAATVVAVALAAFHFPRHDAISAWMFLRWRADWQNDAWPCPRDFLLASGAVLPALRRRVLRRPVAFSGRDKSDPAQAARL